MADITTSTLKIEDNNLILRDADAQAKVAVNTQDITSLKEELSELDENKANIDGYYEDMTVGDAEQLVASQYVEDSVPYSFRTTGGSADVGNREYVDSIVGGTVVWNQLAQLCESRTVFDLTFTNNGDGTVTLSGTASGSGSVAVTTTISLNSSHKYLIRRWDMEVISGNTSSYQFVYAVTSGTVYDETLFAQLVDLTQMFGSTIADYIYSLEQATAGAGVAWFKKLFPKDYYEYNAGELLSVSGLASHGTVGFNQWDEEWEVGGINDTTGEKISVNSQIRSKDYISCVPNTQYYVSFANVGVGGIYLYAYDADGNFLERIKKNGTTVYNVANAVVTTPANCYNIMFKAQYPNSPTTYKNDICINLSWSGWRNGEYEAYQKHSYPLDDSLTLRGILKLDAQNNLYYDGDEYLPDGTVTRKYGIVDLGTLNWAYSSNNGFMYAPYGTKANSIIGRLYVCSHPKFVYQILSANTAWNNGTEGLWVEPDAISSTSRIYAKDSAYTDSATFKAAMSGVYLVYELATPTTETAEPYQHVQICDDFGTEKYVSTSIVPVGHNTRYPANLRDKLQHLPDLADNDGYYMIGQSNKQMHLELFRIPKAPTSPDGTYTLKATVSGGTPTYTWEAQA